ncbi:MAG TPA: diacylglycerol kinase family protein [Candidatus Saccharimonadia bacterium]
MVKNENVPWRVRWLSWLALGLLLVVIGLALWLIAGHLGWALVFSACSALGLVGGWLVLALPGRRRWWGYGLIIAASFINVLVTWRFLQEPGALRRIGWLTLFGWAYTAVAGMLARWYWAAQHPAAGREPASGRRRILIINPKSGDGRAERVHLAERAAEQGIRTIILEPGQDVVELAEQAVAAGAEVLGVSGGDGSLGAVAAVAMRHDVPLVVLPGGTRCHFARDLGLDPDHLVEALAAFEGVERRVDVGLVNGRIFLNNASFGLYAEIVSRPDYREHKAAVTREVMQALARRPEASYPLSFRDGRGRRAARAAQILVGVNRYETLKLGELGGRRRLDEGQLQVLVVPELSPAVLRRLLPTTAVGAAGLNEWLATEFSLDTASGTVMAGVDGESLELTAPVRLRVVPRGLRLLVPAEGRSGRPVRRFSGRAAQVLRELAAGRRPAAE